MPALKQAWQRALLIARHATDGQGRAEPVGVGGAEFGAGRQGVRQQAARNAQQFEQLVIPFTRVDVEQHGARRVAVVGHVACAARELPDQPAVHGAEGELAPFGLRARALDVVKDPLQFGAREVGVDAQAGLALHQGLVPLLAQLRARGFGAPVLPDDGVVHRLAGAPVPHQGGLALVGDADRTHGVAAQAGLGQHLARGLELGVPQVAWIMFDPARARVDLRKLALRHGHHVAFAVEDDAAGTGGALIEGEQVGHGANVR